MAAEALHDGDGSALASMFDAGRAPDRAWRDVDMAAVLWHQLAAPLSVDLGALRGVSPGHVAVLSGAADPPIQTFYDLLRHPSPPVELLAMTKRFAKRARGQPGGAIPDEVAAILYFGSILAARTRRGVRISNLTDGQVGDGVRWALAQPWVDPATRSLFTELPA